MPALAETFVTVIVAAVWIGLVWAVLTPKHREP